MICCITDMMRQQCVVLCLVLFALLCKEGQASTSNNTELENKTQKYEFFEDNLKPPNNLPSFSTLTQPTRRIMRAPTRAPLKSKGTLDHYKSSAMLGGFIGSGFLIVAAVFAFTR